MARTPKPATAAKPEERKPQEPQGADDSLKGAQIPDEAEAPQPPTETKPVGTPAGGTEPPATIPLATEASLATVVSAVDPPKTDPPGVLVVTGPKRGRWRAGWHFGPEPRRLPLAELTEDERAAIEGDPALAVSIEP